MHYCLQEILLHYPKINQFKKKVLPGLNYRTDLNGCSAELIPAIFRPLKWEMLRPQLDYVVLASGAVSSQRFEACGESAVACDAMREGPH